MPYEGGFLLDYLDKLVYPNITDIGDDRIGYSRLPNDFFSAKEICKEFRPNFVCRRPSGKRSSGCLFIYA
jgi:hypothetical protein